MLRTMSMLRKLSWSVFAGLALHAATPSSAPAQELPPKDAAPAFGGIGNAKDGKTYVIQINVTKTIGMTKAAGAAEDPIIEKAQNENPKICRVQAIFNDPRHILVTGISPGTSKITLTGYTDANMKDRRDEVIEIRVPSDDEPVREQLRKDFLELVRKTAPTATIDAIVGPNNAIFLTGNVLTADSVQAVLESARAIFGPGANVINGMRIGGVQQVEVDCVICSVNRSKLRNMSFSWSLNRKDFFLQSLLQGNTFANTITTGIAAAGATQATSGANIIFGSVNKDGAFFGFLNALRTDQLATVQAEPKVVTLSGRPAQFVSGGETPILTSSGNGAPSVTYKTFGTTVTVLPIVLGNGKIHLEIAPLISSLDAAAGISIAGANGITSVPGFKTQGAQVAVQVEDGQTIAIGGLIQHTKNASNSKVPVLGDVPFVGAAFRTVNYNEVEQELIILVTPRLIDPMACNQLPEKLPTRLTRSPDDFELYLEGLLELPRGQRQTCGPNGCYTAPHKLGPTAGVFPCGDNGSCGVTGQRGAGCSAGNCGTPVAPCASGVCTTKTIIAPPPAPMAVGVPAALPVAGKAATQPVIDTRYNLPPAPVAVPPAAFPPTAPVSYNAVPSDLPIYSPPLRLPGTINPLIGQK